MKYYLLLLLILLGTSLDGVSLTVKFTGLLYSVPAVSQMGPIYFIKPVPDKIKLSDKIDLSFMKSSIISVYRYRLEVPEGDASSTDRSMGTWSTWAKDDISKIVIPRLDHEGGYRLIVEYRTVANNETKKFEKTFFVYSADPKKNAIKTQPGSSVSAVSRNTTGSKTPATEPVSRTASVSEKTSAATTPLTVRNAEKPKPMTEDIANKQSPSKGKNIGNPAAAIPKTTAKTTHVALKDQSSTEKSSGTSRVQTEMIAGKITVDNKTTATSAEKTTPPASNRDEKLKAVADNRAGPDKISVPENSISRREAIIVDQVKITDWKTKTMVFQDTIYLHKDMIAETSLNPLDISERDNSDYYDFIFENIEKSETRFLNNNPVSVSSFYDNIKTKDSELLRKPPDIDPFYTGAFKKANTGSLMEPASFNYLLALSASRESAGSLRDSPHFNVFYTGDSYLKDSQLTKNQDSLAHTVSGTPEEPEVVPSADRVISDPGISNAEMSYQAGITKRDLYGIIKEDPGDEDLISVLRVNGISINETDIHGNSPLHLAILMEDKKTARDLINQGADLNIKNDSGLAPLHLAVLRNDNELVANLLNKGADVNLKGNSGYTPLIIASQMNYTGVAKELLSYGAKKAARTNQGLTPRTIAKIQNNNDIVSLLRKVNNDTIHTKSVESNESMMWNRSGYNKYPEIDFNLPFDNKLAKKRQGNKIIQAVSIPALAVSVACLSYFKSEANHYYKLSKIAGTEDMARVYYNKTNKLDRYFYITAEVSLVSAYALIHSTIRKRNISGKMFKPHGR